MWRAGPVAARSRAEPDGLAARRKGILSRSRLPQDAPEIGEGAREIVRVVGAEVPIEPDRFPGRAEGRLVGPERQQARAEAGERGGEIGTVPVGTRADEVPVELKGFAGGCEGVVVGAGVAQSAAEVAQRASQHRAVAGIGVARDEPAQRAAPRPAAAQPAPATTSVPR